ASRATGCAAGRAPGDVARGPLQPADAHLRIHWFFVAPPSVPADQPAASMVAHRGCRPQDDRFLRADPASLHVEVPVVAAARSLCAASPRTAAGGGVGPARAP